jgi:hypothetical protein
MAGRHWNATAGENNSAKPWRDWFVLFAFGTACRMAIRRLALSIVSRPMISRASGRLPDRQHVNGGRDDPKLTVRIETHGQMVAE